MNRYRGEDEAFQQLVSALDSGGNRFNESIDEDIVPALGNDWRDRAEQLLLKALRTGDARAIQPLCQMESEKGFNLMEELLGGPNQYIKRKLATALWDRRKSPVAWLVLTDILRGKAGYFSPGVDEDVIVRNVLWKEYVWRNLRWSIWVLRHSDDHQSRNDAALYLLRYVHVIGPGWNGNEFQDPLFGHIFRRLNTDDLKPDTQKRLVKELIEFSRAHKGLADTMIGTHLVSVPQVGVVAATRGKFREWVTKLLRRWFD